MPRGNGTGPIGGSGSGSGGGMGRGRGMGRMGGNRQGAGPSGECVCPSCGTSLPHKQGVPCYQVKCPNCGGSMTRK